MAGRRGDGWVRVCFKCQTTSLTSQDVRTAFGMGYTSSCANDFDKCGGTRTRGGGTFGGNDRCEESGLHQDSRVGISMLTELLAGQQAPVFHGKVAEHKLFNSEEKLKAKGWERGGLEDRRMTKIDCVACCVPPITGSSVMTGHN